MNPDSLTPITKGQQVAGSVSTKAPIYGAAGALAALLAYYLKIPAELVPAVYVLIDAALSMLHEYAKPVERRSEMQPVVAVESTTVTTTSTSPPTQPKES